MTHSPSPEADPTWNRVEEYVDRHLLGTDEALDAALAASDAAGLPAINVTAAQGKFLHLLARASHASRILEIGTLGGYSTIWLARALPADGRLITLEIDPERAGVARANIARAGLAGRVEIRVAPAAGTLAELIADRVEPFDMIFIDADKVSTARYIESALQLSRAGTVIIVDNVVRKGAIADDASTDANVTGMRGAIELLGANPRLSSTVIQTVGSKGYDGFVFALVTGP